MEAGGGGGGGAAVVDGASRKRVGAVQYCTCGSRLFITRSIGLMDVL